uniref:Putative prolyl 4-hydroxylase alpha subunit n=1 Tax=Anopheles marajoara TaxID=58244 RepID=A0A2M4BVX8_9DIPT
MFGGSLVAGRTLIGFLVISSGLIAFCSGSENFRASREQRPGAVPSLKPVNDRLLSHVNRFKALRDDLHRLQTSKEKMEPLMYLKEMMTVMDALQSMGKEWKDIEDLQKKGPNEEFISLLEDMDPLCANRIQRTPDKEIELRCSYYFMNGDPFYRIGPLKREEINKSPSVVIYRDYITENEVKIAKEKSVVDLSVYKRIKRVAENVFNVAVRRISEKGYNGSEVKHYGLSIMLYLETSGFHGNTLFKAGRYVVSPTSGSLMVSERHPSVCPSDKPLLVITNFDVVPTRKQ